MFFLSVVATCFTLLSGCNASADTEPVRRSVQSLGTIVTITIYDHPKTQYFDEAFDIVDEVYHNMSLQLEDTDLVRLNAMAGIEPVEVSPMTMTVLQEAKRIAVLCGGTFTPMIEPLVKLWDIGGDNPRVPSPEELSQAVNLIHLDYLELYPSDDPDNTPNRAFISTAGAGVDLGGIAKGYAADLVAQYLKSEGVHKAILDFGGNILTIGRKNEERPWIIGVQRPDQSRGIYLGKIPSEDTSVVTSGVYERFFEENGKRYHHLLNPETGYPVENGLEGVVIVSDVSMIADGFSTALFGLGLEKGLALANELDEIEAVFITDDYKIYVSDELAEDFILEDDQYTWAHLNSSDTAD